MTQLLRSEWAFSGLLVMFSAFMMLPSAQARILTQARQIEPLSDPAAPTNWNTIFADVTTEAGIVSQRLGLPRDMVVGQAWGDVTNNGYLDLYITDTAGPNTLYLNNGDGTFTVSPYNDQVALPTAISGGATFVDYDNDGWSDLYVVNWGGNVLYRNLEGQGFEDVTARAGVAGDGNSKTASWGDFDGDGYLDLYVANWSCSPRCGRPILGDKDQFYRNNGDGTFTDVSEWLGSGELFGAGFVASFVDYDNDGDLDIYLVNDEFINPIGNVLWRNDGAGCGGWCFTNVSQATRANAALMGMGLATGDFNNSGRMDFFFSNAGPMQLLESQPDGTFADVAFAAGVDNRAMISWGVSSLDVNNDGWLDLYVAVASRMNTDPTGNPLHINNGDGTFSLLGAMSGAYDTGSTIGVAAGDYDNDGWVDLVVGNANTGHFLYRNQGVMGAENGRLVVHLIGGGRVNRDAVGARVLLTLSDGLRLLQEVKLGSSLGSGETLLLHFGLGVATVQDLTVIWPDGTRYSIGAVPANSRITLPYPQADGLRLALVASPSGVMVWLPALFALALLIGLVAWRRQNAF